ncbi:MAG: ABC transporter ATP-binding protein [Gemmatimonadetes bacterium]|nr:ABC transporter ATP-binding protein [Gemmatimonadota bacterium]
MSWKVGLSLLLLIAAGLTQGISLLMLIPLLQVVGLDVEQGATGQIAQSVASLFAAAGVRPTLGGVLGAYVLVVGLQALLTRWQVVANLALQQEFVLYLRQRLYRALARSQWLFFARHRASDFAHALTDELDRVDEATSSLLSLAHQVVVVSVYLLLALHLSLPLTALTFACGAALLLLLRRRNLQAHAAGEEITHATRDLFAAVSEHLGGMKTTRSHGAEERNIALFTGLSQRVTRAHVAATRTYADTSAWFKVGSVSILSLILYVAVERAVLSVAGILLLLFLFARLVPKFSAIQEYYQYLMTSLPAFATVWRTVERCEAAAEAPSEGAVPVTMRTGVRLESVSFSYGDARPTVAGIDLFVPAQSTIALVGPSGAGKSTLADLLMGLIVPDRGQLVVDGVPLTPGRLRAWRERIAYVPQETFLFHDTIRANLLWAEPAAAEAEMLEALRLAAAADFVLALPAGLDTVIGDRGVRLSGGERQRIALARALLRRPTLLILDEATSALDSENERRVQQAIERLHGRMTILVITHRLSTIRGADIIYVLDHGFIVEHGSWNELTARSRRFAALCTAQQLGHDAYAHDSTLPTPAAAL